MDPSSLVRCGQFVKAVAGAVYSHKGIRSTRTYHPRRHVSFSDVQASYGLHYQRAMRMSADAFYDLVDRLRPRLSRRGVPPDVPTAISLRYLGGGSYLDICATLGVHTCTVYRSLLDFVDAVNSTPFLDLDFQLSSSPRRLTYASGFQSRRRSPFGNVWGTRRDCGQARATSLDGRTVYHRILFKEGLLRSEYSSHLRFRVQVSVDGVYQSWRNTRLHGLLRNISGSATVRLRLRVHARHDSRRARMAANEA